jgi:methylisocitrate lyase
MPDLAVTTLNDVVEDAKRIVAACDIPLLVDIDTGFGTGLNIARTIQDLERIGVAGVHIEDQVLAKRCGHRPGKQIVETEEMVDRIKAAVAARRDTSFVVMARTDAMASEGLEGVINRCLAYKDAGADMIFPEALTKLEEYTEVADRVGLPILANITEFGKTPLYSASELAQSGVSIVLYPLSAFRAMSLAASMVYGAIASEGTQKNVLDQMHTRQQIYDIIGYDKYEKQMDDLFGKQQ